jgi:hypothetical protein
VNLRATVALAVAIVVAGYALIVRPLEARIADRYAVLAVARATIDDGSARVQSIASAERERERLRALLAPSDLDARPVTALQRFLETVSAAAARNGTTIRTLDAEPTAPQRSMAAAALFEEQALRLTLHGSYGSLLATLRALIGAPQASRISIEALAPDDRRSATGLVASVHVVLLHLPERERVRTQSH